MAEQNVSSADPFVLLGWEPMPTYSSVFWEMTTTYKACIKRYNDGLDTYMFPFDIEQDFGTMFNMTSTDGSLIVLLAIAFTVLRQVLSGVVFTPMARYMELTKESISKLPESIWKLAYYFSMWSYTYYVVVYSGKYRFFQRPSTVWDDWSATADVPTDIYYIYIVQLAFYGHSIYALFFQDIWRKDSVVMAIHHFVTVFLIWISYVCRYHNIGALVLLFHDFCDIELEFSKVNVYLKMRAGKLHKVHDYLAAVSFLSLTITWFISRLYYFPLKVLYAASTVFNAREFIPPYVFIINTMLILLLAMNIFWFYQLMAFLYKILSGELQELEDTREYDVVEKLESLQDELQGGKHEEDKLISSSSLLPHCP